MPAVFLTPYPRFRAMDAGDPLAGAKLYTYEPGTTTPKATYTDDTGNTANTNPVICDANGECDLWLEAPTRLVLKTAADVAVWDRDNIEGVGYAEAGDAADEWFDLGLAITYLSGTQFRVPGDRRSTYQVNRRARVTATGTTYSMITAASYDGGNDWTVVTLETSILTVSVSAVAVGFVSSDDSSVDVRGLESTTEYAYKTHNLAASAAPTTTDDDGSGYSVGSVWIDTTADLAYLCLDATTSNAVWLPVSPLTTAGDIIIRGATAAQRLAIGTPGQSLRVPNSGTGPSWGFMGGFEPIASLVASGESLIEFFHDGIDNSGDPFADDWQYRIDYEDVICSTAKSMALQLFEAGAYRAGSGTDDYWQARMQNNAGTASAPYATTDTEIIIGVAPGSLGSGDAMNGRTEATNLGSSAYKSYLRTETLGVGPSGGVGFYGQATPYGTNVLRAATKLKIFPLSGGTIDAGRFTLSRRKLR